MKTKDTQTPQTIRLNDVQEIAQAKEVVEFIDKLRPRPDAISVRNILRRIDKVFDEHIAKELGL